MRFQRPRKQGSLDGRLESHILTRAQYTAPRFSFRPAETFQSIQFFPSKSWSTLMDSFVIGVFLRSVRVALHIFLTFLHRTNSALLHQKACKERCTFRQGSGPPSCRMWDRLLFTAGVIVTTREWAHTLGFWLYCRLSTGYKPQARNIGSSERSGTTSRRHLFKIHVGTHRCQTSEQQTLYPTKNSTHSALNGPLHGFWLF